MENINWGKLVNQGRAKAYGVPWTEEEAKARVNGVPAEDIRNGTWKEKKEEETKTSKVEVGDEGTDEAEKV